MVNCHGVVWSQGWLRRRGNLTNHVVAGAKVFWAGAVLVALEALDVHTLDVHWHGHRRADRLPAVAALFSSNPQLPSGGG